MLATRSVEAALMALLGADTANFGEVALVHMVLFKNNLTLTPDTQFSDLVLADFDGYASKACGALPQHVFADPNTGDNIMEVNPPAGGWHFQTTGVTNLPQTIYGFAITDSAGAVLLSSELLTNPVVLTASGQGFDIARALLRLPLGTL